MNDRDTEESEDSADPEPALEPAATDGSAPPPPPPPPPLSPSQTGSAPLEMESAPAATNIQPSVARVRDRAESPRPSSRARRSSNRRSSARRARPSRREVTRHINTRLKAINSSPPALTGISAEIDQLIKKNKPKSALKRALKWRSEAPLDVLSLISLGRALHATGDAQGAARAFGSVIDFFPSRADLRRMISNWLETLGEAGYALAEASYAVAQSQRPDHPSVYHMRAMVLVKTQRYEEALKVALEGIIARRVSGRFNQVTRILQEDAQMIATAWIRADKEAKSRANALLKSANLSVDTTPSVRFILTWETDANDVDFHIYDAYENHAYYSKKRLASGGRLYADITTGYGPECFMIPEPDAFPYHLQAHYYRRGPMGYGGGKLQVIRFDGAGRLSFEERPFVIMNDRAFIDLGVIKGPKKGKKGKKGKKLKKHKAKVAR